MLVVGVFMAAEFPERRDELYALRDAPTCEASPQGSAECQWPQEFIVSEIRIDDLGRTRYFSAMLTTPNQKSKWPVEFRNDGPLLKTLRDGDRVTGTIWRGDVVKIAVGHVVQNTTKSPTSLAETMLVLAVWMGLPGLLLVYVCCWRLARWSQRIPTAGMNCVLGLSGGLLLTGGVAAMIAMSIARHASNTSAPEIDTRALWLFAVIYGSSTAIMVFTIVVVMYRIVRKERTQAAAR
jgi:hypothetical protein